MIWNAILTPWLHLVTTPSTSTDQVTESCLVSFGLTNNMVPPVQCLNCKDIRYVVSSRLPEGLDFGCYAGLELIRRWNEVFPNMHQHL